MDWQEGHRVVTLKEAIKLVEDGGCLRCQWVAAGMVLRVKPGRLPKKKRGELRAKALEIRGRAIPTRHV
jgi:hypothetical protein